MALANVVLTNTFDDWRTRTNQILVQGEQTFVVANGAFNKANAVNAYAVSIGLSTNSYSQAIGLAGNNYSNAVGLISIATSSNAVNLISGTVPSARISGSYTGITGVGTIAAGVWNGTTVAVAYGGTGGTTQAAARSGLGLGTIATQGSGAVTITGGSITGITDLAVADGGTGASDASTARTNLGLGTIATQGSGAVTITGGSITGITDIAVADGGTGASDQAGARTNLGLVIGTNVQAWDANLDQIAALAPTDNNFIVGNGTAWTLETPSSARTSLGLGTMATQDSSSVSISGGSISGLTSLAVSGAITATGDITAFSSDSRLKGDVQTITDALSKVKLITGITYRHNDLAKSFGYTDENRFAGVLAQEVEAVLPEVVVPAPFDVADDGTSKSGENYKTVKYDKIVSLLIEAIKELSMQVESMKLEIKELKK